MKEDDTTQGKTRDEAQGPSIWKTKGLIPTLLVLSIVGFLIWQPSSRKDAELVPQASDSQHPVIARGAASKKSSPLSPEEAKSGCRLPALGEEGVPSKDIVYKEGVTTEAQGGVIEAGLYRLRSAHSSKENFTAGRWSMLLDLAENGQGAYYRKLGLRPMTSSIQWQAEKSRFDFEMKCPDGGKRSFGYSVTDSGLTLIAEGGFVLSLEKVGDSRVALLDEAKP